MTTHIITKHSKPTTDNQIEETSVHLERKDTSDNKTDCNICGECSYKSIWTLDLIKHANDAHGMEKPRTSDQSKLIYYLSEKNWHLLEEIMDMKNSLKGVIMKQDEQVRQSKNSDINTEVTHKHVENSDKI